MLKICKVSDFEELWGKLDTNSGGLVTLDEFENANGVEEMFYQLSGGRNYIHKSQMFFGLVWSTTGVIPGFHLQRSEFLEFAIERGSTQFLAFCL